MMPGETNLPVPSTTSAPAGICTFVPTAAILPSRMTMVPLSIVPRVTVRMVALRMATTPGAAAWPRSRTPDAAGRSRAVATTTSSERHA